MPISQRWSFRKLHSRSAPSNGCWLLLSTDALVVELLDFNSATEEERWDGTSASEKVAIIFLEQSLLDCCKPLVNSQISQKVDFDLFSFFPFSLSLSLSLLFGGCSTGA
jgi:hypothetical protein